MRQGAHQVNLLGYSTSGMKEDILVSRLVADYECPASNHLKQEMRWVPGGRAVKHLVTLLRREHPRHAGRRWQNVRHLGIVPLSHPDEREATGGAERCHVLDRR